MKAFKLEGTSMLPLFRDGDIVLVRPLGSDPLRHPFRGICHRGHRTAVSPTFGFSAGDCAVYEFEGRRLLHRVTGKEAGGLWLSDDSGRLEPHRVPWERIEGKVLSRNPLKNGLIGLAYSKLRRSLFRHVHRDN